MDGIKGREEGGKKTEREHSGFFFTRAHCFLSALLMQILEIFKGDGSNGSAFMDYAQVYELLEAKEQAVLHYREAGNYFEF
jgi:hypothetical protein